MPDLNLISSLRNHHELVVIRPVVIKDESARPVGCKHRIKCHPGGGIHTYIHQVHRMPALTDIPPLCHLPAPGVLLLEHALENRLVFQIP